MRQWQRVADSAEDSRREGREVRDGVGGYKNDAMDSTSLGVAIWEMPAYGSIGFEILGLSQAAA